jgi:hypothetical protein
MLPQVAVETRPILDYLRTYSIQARYCEALQKHTLQVTAISRT